MKFLCALLLLLGSHYVSAATVEPLSYEQIVAMSAPARAEYLKQIRMALAEMEASVDARLKQDNSDQAREMKGLFESILKEFIPVQSAVAAQDCNRGGRLPEFPDICMRILRESQKNDCDYNPDAPLKDNHEIETVVMFHGKPTPTCVSNENLNEATLVTLRYGNSVKAITKDQIRQAAKKDTLDSEIETAMNQPAKKNTAMDFPVRAKTGKRAGTNMAMDFPVRAKTGKPELDVKLSSTNDLAKTVKCGSMEARTAYLKAIENTRNAPCIVGGNFSTYNGGVVKHGNCALVSTFPDKFGKNQKPELTCKKGQNICNPVLYCGTIKKGKYIPICLGNIENMTETCEKRSHDNDMSCDPMKYLTVLGSKAAPYAYDQTMRGIASLCEKGAPFQMYFCSECENLQKRVSAAIERGGFHKDTNDPRMRPPAAVETEQGP